MVFLLGRNVAQFCLPLYTAALADWREREAVASSNGDI
jgi:hypothetical protein